ncbi:FGGY family carbohydrate kinase [Marinactinospora endophytica]
MARRALLGIDLGTSGVKATLLGVDGTTLGEGDAAYPVHTRRPGWAETDPREWWRAVVRAVRAGVERSGPVEVAAIGLDGQMHGLVLVEEDATPVRPAILWADQRADTVMARWRGLAALEQDRLANPLVPGMTGPLLSWVAEHEPAALRRARWALLPKDWIRLRMTGAVGTDPSDASATLLWDMPTGTWSPAAVALTGAPSALLPPVLASDRIAGGLGGPAAEDLGLVRGTPVAGGAGDTPAALLATGLEKGQAQITVGSGAQIVMPVTSPLPVPALHVYRTAERTGWYRMAAVHNAGIALEWMRNLLGAQWDEVYAALDRGEPGAHGVTFVPHLTGERTPVLDPSATAALSGLRLSTDRATLLRAAVEGVAFSVRHAADALPDGLPPQVRLAGGGSRSPAFRRLLADVLGVGLRPIRLRSASALGAALLAARAVAVPEPAVAPQEEPVITPGPNVAAYAEAYERYLSRIRSDPRP